MLIIIGREGRSLSLSLLAAMMIDETLTCGEPGLFSL